MIEKLDPIKHTDNLYDKNGFITNVAHGGVVIKKINELVDAVNEIMTWRFETDDVQTPAENVPQPIKLYVCPDGSVYDNEDVAKSHAASMFNPLPAGATTTDRVYLEQELDRTRKALDVAVDALREICAGVPSDKWVFDTANKAINESTKKEAK